MFTIRQQGAIPGARNRFEFLSPLDKETYATAGGLDVINASRCGDLPYWKRPDFIRDIRFGDINTMPWETISLNHRYMTITPNNKLRMVTKPIKSTLTPEDGDIYTQKAIRITAALTQLATATTHQIAAITYPNELQEVHTLLKKLYIAGVVQKSPNTWAHHHTIGDLWHINTKTLEYNHWLETIGSWEAGMIKGSTTFDDAPGANASSATRHTLLMSEIMIRAMEYTDNIAGFWGEQVLPASVFYDAPVGDESRQSHGDGALVTRDGKIIVFELVGGSTVTHKSIAEKAASWTAVCGLSMMDMCVVFVSASFSVTWRDLFRAVDIGIKQESKRYVSSEAARARGAAKIYVANAAAWFPDVGANSIGFTRLLSRSTVYNCAIDPLIPDPKASNPTQRWDLVHNTMLAMQQPSWVAARRWWGDVGSSRRLSTREDELSSAAAEVARGVFPSNEKRYHPQRAWLGDDGLPRSLLGGGLGAF